MHVYDTLTVRLPSALKNTVEAAARARSTTLTGLVREALTEAVQPSQRGYPSPGNSEAFETFLREAEESRVLLLVEASTGNHIFFEGQISFWNESLVSVKRGKESAWVILRRDVVGWYKGTNRALNDLAIALTRQGWASRR